MALLSIVAQNTMDLYYQQFKSEDDFFEHYHFAYLNSVAYHALLQEEYETAYRLSLQSGEGPAAGDINSTWGVQEEISMERSETIAPYVARLKHKPMAFKYDRSNVGIQEVVPHNDSCGEFVRMGIQEKWKLKLAPVTSVVFWMPLGDRLYFSNAKCGPGKVTVIYIPAIGDCMDETAEVSDANQEMIIRRSLDLLQNAKNGSIINMSEDGNPNKTIETEINERTRKTGR